MIDYELALKLKKAGFKQEGDGKYILQSGKKPDCYCPTLAELIKACGDNFESLEYSPYMPKIGKKGYESTWFARSSCHGKVCKKYDKVEDIVYKTKVCKLDNEELGDTPETAVANLWLALNEK